jgi:hypothetical protein
MKAKTLAILWVVIEVAASVRAMLATWQVVMDVSKGDLTFSVFTVAVIELAFLVSLFSIGLDASAPIAAFLTLGFSAAMQYLEVLTLSGTLSPNEKQVLRAVIAFAPIAILFLSYIRRLVGDVDVVQVVTAALAGASASNGKSDTRKMDLSIAASGRTCSECGELVPAGNAKRTTCSAACRVARSRRLAKS